MATEHNGTMKLAEDVSHEDARIFRRRVLAWMHTLHDSRSPIWQYRLFSGADTTVYSSCFALYLRHLLDDLTELTPEQRKEWVNYLQSFQDERSGLFKDPDADGRTSNANHDSEHLSQQLTTFCLSALGCLDEKPRYPLRFVSRWYDKTKLLNWLDGLNWHNPWNSGNKVMFAAIHLICNDETFGDRKARAALEVWFEWMDRNQKSRNGFWGKGRLSDYFYGMGGYYHQYVIYNYIQRAVNHEHRTVDAILRLQQHDGLFFPGNGGGSCDDIDGIDVLVNSYHKSDYRRDDIRKGLKRALNGIMKNQNMDGGFAWAKRRYFSPATYWNLVVKNAGSFDWYYWYYCNRKFFGKLYKFKGVVPLVTGWSRVHRIETDSSLFDTWLRCTAIGEICSVLKDEPLAPVGWKFLKTAGLGWFALPASADGPVPVSEQRKQAA